MAQMLGVTSTVSFSEAGEAPSESPLKSQNRGSPTTHHPHKRPSSSDGIFEGGVVCELSEPKKKGKLRTTPSFALAMLIVDFVGMVRGFAVRPNAFLGTLGRGFKVC